MSSLEQTQPQGHTRQRAQGPGCPHGPDGDSAQEPGQAQSLARERTQGMGQGRQQGLAGELAQGLAQHFCFAERQRLARSTVGIAGAGGLGSNAAMLLARSGVGRFVLVDGDKVEPGNLNRQFYWPEDVGRAKAEALKERLLSLEPALELEAHVRFLKPEEAPVVFAGCDAVVEALDAAALKSRLCESLLTHGFFVVAASGLGGLGRGPEGRMHVRRLGGNFVCVGDFTSGVSPEQPALAPRVMQAAAMQADAVLERLLL